jgi:hypothetical protein
MAFTSTIQAADITLASLLTLKEKITFDDVEGTPETSINWHSGLALPNLSLQTAAAAASASNPVETAATAVWGDLITASGTTHTLDLSALARGTELGVLDLTGLKVQAFLLAAPFANTDDVALVTGAVNGYNLQNDAAFKIVVAPAGVELCVFPENTANSTGMPAVGASDLALDFSSAMSNFQIYVVIIAG